MQNAMQEYADFLVSIFVKHSNPEDIHEAVLLYQAALDLASRNEGQSAYEGDILLRLSQALLLITEKTDKQDEADACIDEAIDYLQASTILLDDGSENLTNARKLLNACLLERYDTKGDPNDLKKFAELTGDDEGLASNIILDLKHTKVVDISNTHDAQELEDMIMLFRNTLTKEPFPHPKRPTILVSLGKALSLLFKFGGSRKQLDEAILHLREAVALLPKSAIALLTLSEVLIQKAMLEEFRSTREYIEEANVHLHKGFHLIGTYPGESDDFIQQMYGRLCGGDLGLLDHVSMIQELNSKNTGNDSSDSLARNMSYLLEMSFEMSGNMKELDDSIYHAREAATAFPENDPQSAALLHDLGHKLVRRYQGLNNLDDLDEALHLYFKSIQVLPPNHYFHSLYLGDFGIALILRLGHIKDMGEMFNILSYVSMLFQTGAIKSTSSPVPDRFRSAKLWALLADTFNHESALEAYEQAISFLPRLSSMATNITARQETFKLSSIDGLSRNAALFAIKIGRYDKAIEFLEAGRAIFWLQSLHLRSPMDRLQNAAPNLHMRLSEISVELDRASMRMNVSCTPENIAGKQIQDEELFQLEDLNEEWQRTLDEVHELEEFKDFLSPLKISRLQKLVGHPVIFLIPGEHQSHALVMSTNEVKHIDLPNAPYDMLQKLAAHLPGSGPRGRFRGIQDELQAEAGIDDDYLAQSDSHERKGGPRHFNHIEDDNKIKHVLEVLWRDVVQLIIVALDPYMNGSSLEVCWCPTGIFSFLPLHAAGIYNDNMSSIESAFDYLISSYSPTVSASTHNEPPSDTTEEFKMMVVVDRESLPNTIHELTAIEKHVDPECLIKMGTQECPALVERAASNLPNVSIAHFACHGMQLKDNPLNSALMLKDGNLKISRIMEERIPNAALAFLCACETAMGVKDLPDEAMHLGATLLFSGFRRVVATMWSIDDEDGPIVADTFYARLFRDDSRRPDTNAAAEAIHAATAVLRERGASFKRWVPFIHLGT
ncbi:CHAT domain-containing protein [Cyathus striatus]|nr:CHAT domain-containing protein [Cyathus striatus]